MIIKRENIKLIEFVFENCETIKIPIECFNKINIDEWGEVEHESTLNEFHCVIEDNGDMKYGMGFDSFVAPMQRINKYDDITSIYIYFNNTDEYKDGFQLYINWGSDYNRCDNINQRSNKISYSELELKIGEFAREFNISEVLEFDDNTKFYDAEGKEYRIYEDDETSVKYIFDEIISDKLINQTFYLKKLS